MIVKLGSIGDVVHTLPSLARIKNALPESEIGWAVDSRSAEILRDNTLIDHLIELKLRSAKERKSMSSIFGALAGQRRLLREHRFDVAIDFQGLIKSAAVAKLSGAKKRWGFERRHLREPAGRIMLTDTAKVPDKTHVIRKNLILSEMSLGLPPAEELFEFPIAAAAEHRVEALRILDKTGGNIAILNPAGGWVTKLWPAENFGELADRIWSDLGIVPVLTIAPSEKALAQKAIEGSRSGKLVVVEPSLRGFFELAKQARIYVGGDTGPTHIAIAARTPIVGIFGPTEWWRNGSIRDKDICVERTDIDCRIDCHRRTCSNWICMNIGVDTVFEAVRRRLDQALA